MTETAHEPRLIHSSSIPAGLADRIEEIMPYAIQRQIGYRLMYRSRRPETFSDIDIDDTRIGVALLTVGKATRHEDDEFGWTLIWPIIGCGQNLCVAESRERTAKIDRALLDPGHALLFDSRLPHWTEGPAGPIVLAIHEIGTAPLSDRHTGAIDIGRNFEVSFRAMIESMTRAAELAIA